MIAIFAPQARLARPLRRRAIAAALAINLSLETGSAHAAPSERDQAYERGVQAEEAGDHARAAAEFARAYRLTPPGETGPRLLFLRASVGARLRARDGGGEPREHLCQARALLREHLAGAAPTPGADPLADERASLARVEQDLGDVDCEAPAPPVPKDTSQDPPVPKDTSTSPDAPVPEDTSSDPRADPPKAPVPGDSSAPLTRAPVPRRSLRIAGAAALGLGAAALVPMSVGIALARDATRDGRKACWSTDSACDASSPEIDDIRERGARADLLVKIGAPIAAAALLTGAILLGLGLRRRAPPPVTLSPRIGPGAAGLGLQGRF